MKKIEKKRLISFTLTVAVILGLFTGVNFSVSAKVAYSELAEWTGISNRAELEAMKDKRDGNYYLTKDIDLSGAEWIPIGNNNYGGGAFTGSFDGQGYIISNLKITGNYEHSGLFGYAENAVIKNVGLEGININITVDYDVYAGGICGYGDNVEILNSYTSGNISAVGFHSYTGGLIGFSDGIITNCYTLCNISASSSGTNTGSAGGLVGECGDSLAISNCYAAGNVSASSSNQSMYAGGLIGHSQNYDTLITTDCYRLSSKSVTGGGTTDQSGTSLTDSQMKQKSSFAGFDFNTVWGIDEGNSYPYLRVFVCNISISSVTGRPGKDISVTAEITNNPGIAAYKLIVSYDANNLEYIGGTNATTVGADGLLEIYAINDDKTNNRVVVVTVNGSDVTEDGLLFTLKFKVKTETLSGDYPLTLSYEENKDIKKENNISVNPQLTNGMISVVKVMRGDSNGDGSVDIGDLICLARHFAQIAFITDSICIEAADVNNDGELTIADLVRLARHIAEIELLPTE